MQYLSLDIETTGTNPDTCQILEVGAVLDNLKNPLPVGDLPVFHCYVQHDEIYGHPVALSMNKDIIEELSKENSDYKRVLPSEIGPVLSRWLIDQEYNYYNNDENAKSILNPINIAGKNFDAFDRKFLSNIPNFKNYIYMHRRSIDPAVLYMNPDDSVVPDMKTCMERIGMYEEVPHNAVDDAKIIVKLLRHKML